MSKNCVRCGVEYPLECFHRNYTYKDGRVSVCKGCRSEYIKSREYRDTKKYYERHKAEILVRARVKYLLNNILKGADLRV